MPDKTKNETIRAVVRALNLLRTMNQRPVWTLHDLHNATRLPKPTLWRLLATLIGEGYVRAEEPAGTYRLAAKIRELDAGYTEYARLIDAGRPIALKITKQIKWPLALGMPDQDAIVVQFSTMPYSPLAVQTTTLGHRLGLFDSAMGQVYLAFCSEAERRSMLEALAGADQTLGWVRQEMVRVRADGYAVRQPGHTRGSATLAVPLLRDGTAIAALGMTTFGRSMTRATIDRHLPILVETARSIVAALESSISPAGPDE